MGPGAQVAAGEAGSRVERATRRLSPGQVETSRSLKDCVFWVGGCVSLG